MSFRLLWGGPHGVFLGWFPGRMGLYPENAEIQMPGVAPWIVKTNRWGIRGDDVSIERTPGLRRIAMVGDSITDGFFVENKNTYPAFTASRLREGGVPSEVINFARGGGTIDMELAVLREVVRRFSPDVVVLTFVTNDLAGLSDLDDGQLLRRRLVTRNLRRSVLEAAVTRMAAGERAFDVYLRWRSTGYRSALSEKRNRVAATSDRYGFTGSSDFAMNSRRFAERFKDTDARLLVAPLTPETEIDLRRYLVAWDLFVDTARAVKMTPVFVYFPAYPEIYDPAIPTLVRGRLRKHSEGKRVPFLDLTAVLQSQGTRVLHLTPADYHLNPQGNRVIGEALGAFLADTVFGSPR